MVSQELRRLHTLHADDTVSPCKVVRWLNLQFEPPTAAVTNEGQTTSQLDINNEFEASRLILVAHSNAKSPKWEVRLHC